MDSVQQNQHKSAEQVHYHQVSTIISFNVFIFNSHPTVSSILLVTMKFFTFFLFLAALLGLALADGAAILGAMKEVVAETKELEDTVASYNGRITVLFKVLSKNRHLLKILKRGVIAANQSAPLEGLDALAVAKESEVLVEAAKSSLSTIVRKKRRFKGFLRHRTLHILKKQRAASRKFSDAIIEKVPEELREVAKLMSAPVDVAFNDAIAAYEKH